VSDQQPDRYPSGQPGPDLEYDLAHEETSESGNVSPEHVEQQITVATGTPEYDGDYSYDLAHDISGR
jgi:hypothetical protein